MGEPPSPAPAPERKARPQQAVWFRYTDTASVGIEIVIAIGGCTLAAWYLEQHVTHWSPWTTLLGLVIGLGAAGKALVRTANNYRRELARSADPAPENPRPPTPPSSDPQDSRTPNP